MAKWFVLFVCTIFSNNFLFAQRNSLEIRGKETHIYLEHVVTAKESFYSVGRMYNVSPKELAIFNHLHLAAGLKIGETLKIPLNKINFTQTGVRSKTEVNVPVYHSVESGETLYRLGVNYNKVSVASLKRWNHLRSNELTAGMPVIVGFLKVDKENSPLANRHYEPSVQVTEVPEKTGKPEEQQRRQTVAAVTEIKQQEPETSVNNATPPSQPNENTITATAVRNKATINFSGGYFKNLYNRQNQNKSPIDKSGQAGVFKSTSGWEDGKYYCFNNDVSAGTVLKITDNTTGKSVYAKVLDAIPDIKQNDGLSIVISNAAADELGAGADKFDCVVSFGK